MSRISRYLKRRLSARRTSQQPAPKHTPVPAMFEALEPRVFLTVTTEGDELLRSDLVRDYFNVDGTSIKVGVIANGIDSYSSSYSAGELPDMDDDDHINPDITGSGNTGTKMLEVIHDIAPGAELFFSSYGSGVDDAKNAVTYLIDAGCDVIVDDICLMDQPYFQLDATWDPGTGSVQSFAGWLEDQLDSNPNITYLTGAGEFSDNSNSFNIGGFHYQADYNEGTDDYHAFNTSGNEALYKQIQVNNGSTLHVTLQWSDPFGDSNKDFSLLLYSDDGTSNLLISSNNPQTGSGCLPLEQIQWTNTSGSISYVYLRILGDNFEDPVKLELYGWGEGYVESEEWNTASDAIFGHKVLDEVITVGAISGGSYTFTEIYGELNNTDFENILQNDEANPNSSRGPSTIYTDFAQPMIVEKPSLWGISVTDVETSLYSLRGTAGAAAHIAGIAALLLDIDSTLSGSEIKAALQSTAIDMGSTGYDNQNGNGRFDALSAAYKVYTPQQLDMQSSSDSGQYNDDNITNNQRPYFQGYTPAITTDGSYVVLMCGDSYLNSTTSNDATGYFHIDPDSNHPLSNGINNVTFVIAENSYMYLTKHVYSNPAPVLPVTIDTVASSIIGNIVNDGETQRSNLNKIEITFSDVMTTSNLEGALQLWWWDKTGSGSWVQQTEGSGYDFEITSFNYASGVATWEIDDSNLGDGHYKIAFLASGIQDRAGNALTGGDYSFNTHRLAGDINGDKAQTAADIDLLQDIRFSRITPSVLSQFSLDGDGDVDANDVSTLVTSIFGTFMGDANLDGSVDGEDFNALLANWGTYPNPGHSAWSAGDFSGDTYVAGEEFDALVANWGSSTTINLVDTVAEFNTLFGTPPV